MINSKMKIELIEYPYNMWVIDDFLKQHIIEDLNANWIAQDTGLWGSSYNKFGARKNILEDGMRWLNDYDLMPKEIVDVIKYFHTMECTEKISKITKIGNLIKDESRNWSGMRTMLPDSYQLIHSDATTHPVNKLRKKLTCILYLNENYDRKRDEGCLEVWNDNMTKKEYELEPINNRFVIFLNSNTAYHGVPIVKSERRAITFSILSNNLSKETRTKALFVPRKEDNKKKINKLADMRLKV